MSVANPGYYAVIPADVRYDDSIPANAKLLYGEISALVGADGYCFASNQYFAELYGVAEETISRLLAKLEKAGHILRELERDETGQVVKRRLYLKVSAPGAQPLDEIVNTSPQKSQEGIDKKVKDTNTSNNIIIKENKKRKAAKTKKVELTREQVEQMLFEWYDDLCQGAPMAVADRLWRDIRLYLDHRDEQGIQYKDKCGVTALCHKLMRLSDGNLSLMCEMLETAVERGWRTVYPPKGGQASRPTPQPQNPGEETVWL